MPSLVLDINDDAYQKHTLLFGDSEIALELRFLPPVEQWMMNIDYKGKRALGLKLAVGVLHMASRNFPFDFAVRDTSRAGLDPYRLEDFSSGRCELYLLDDTDMQSLRGVSVPL
jgi:hypothetical protein